MNSAAVIPIGATFGRRLILASAPRGRRGRARVVARCLSCEQEYTRDLERIRRGGSCLWCKGNGRTKAEPRATVFYETSFVADSDVRRTSCGRYLECMSGWALRHSRDGGCPRSCGDFTPRDDSLALLHLAVSRPGPARTDLFAVVE